MKRFKEMIEHVRIHGIKISDTVHDYAPERPNDDILPLFFYLVEQCQPFVMFQKNATPEEVVSYDDPTFDPSSPINNAPFSVYSLEMFGDHISISVPREDDRIKVYCDCLLAYEVSPMKFLSFAYTSFRNPKTGETGKIVMLTSAYNDILKEMTNRISVEDAGFENVNEKVKVGTGNNKRFHKIRKVIYVKPKSVKISTRSDIPSTIDWTHRWLVRGHWRKFAGLGKDREGNYTVEGHTWVTEHAKGPEDMPLIQKVRVVKNN